MNIYWVLGAADHEMNVIENLLRQCGQTFVYAVDRRSGVRVDDTNAYGDVILPQNLVGFDTVCLVECGSNGLIEQFGRLQNTSVVKIDHHNPGDAGFRASPDDFLDASSIGQVFAMLANEDRLTAPQFDRQENKKRFDNRNFFYKKGGQCRYVSSRHNCFYTYLVPDDIVYTAAADHCLEAAYRGECNKYGIEKHKLLSERIRLIALDQQRPEDKIRDEVDIVIDFLGRIVANSDNHVSEVYDLSGFGCLRAVVCDNSTADSAFLAICHHSEFSESGADSLKPAGICLLFDSEIPHLYEVSLLKRVAYSTSFVNDEAEVWHCVDGAISPDQIMEWMLSRMRNGDMVHGCPHQGFAYSVEQP